MGSETTPRDRVWAAIIKNGANGNRFKVGQVAREIDYDDRPSEETIRRTLRAGKDLGVIAHTSGSPYYKLSSAALARRLR